MSDTGNGGAAPAPAPIQGFIFARELAEVYLLLDHISGRYDKSLQAAEKTLLANGADAATGRTLEKDWIEQVCRIGWPPQGDKAELATQAATLLRVKDFLNGAARPASGATIAFSILVVAGDGEAPGGMRSWRRRAPPAGTPPQPPAPPLPGAGWGSAQPSRMSLATLAYPGLVSTAERFRVYFCLIIVFLFVWLLFTCGLSWNIATGHAILSRIDAAAKVRADITAKMDADQDVVKPSAVPAAPLAVVRPYCIQHRAPATPATPATADAPSAAGAPPVSPDQFDSLAALRLCQAYDSNALAFRIGYAELADWVVAWGWLKWVQHHVLCGAIFSAKECLADGRHEDPLTPNATDELWGSALNEVLASAVLPVCYGILGAGAAVVRDLWGKMRDSLLSPRDLTLALGQLALGAVIGACIGLFVTPNGAASGGTPTLTGTVALSASALSFIAGFGVEGVFVALEGLIKRIFNVPQPGT
jgi:hypothetical protein